MRYIKLILLCFASVSCLGGTVELHGRLQLINGKLPTTVALLSYADEGFSHNDTVNPDGTFTIQLSLTHAGLYNLRLAHSSYEVMLSPNEKVCNITAEIDNDVLKNIQVVNSPENDAYKTLYSIAMTYDRKLNQHFINCDKPDSCEPVLQSLLTAYSQELNTLKTTYPNTYAATALVPMKMPTIAKSLAQTTAEFRKDYFAHTSFADTALLGTPIYRDMLGIYVNFLIEPRYSMQQEFLNYITRQAAAQPLVLKKTAIALFEELYKLPREKMLGMFIDWYSSHKDAVNSAVLDTKVKSISRVMPGQPMLPATAKDSSGNTKLLKNITDKNKCTLLLFWSSECSHCREEMPLIKEVYQRYHAKGFDIYAVSVDYDLNKWKAYINKEHLSWTNVYTTQDSQPNPAIDYVIMNTPTMVLIDQQGIIIHRFTPKNKLDKYISEIIH